MRPSSIFLLSCLLILAAFFTPTLPVQAADPAVQAQLDHFNRVVGTRVETVAILDGEDGASGGLYSFNNESSLNITKFGGRGTVGEPRPIGTTGMTWLPLIGGHIGYSEAKNDFKDISWLAGNSERYTSYALGCEAGARIFLTDQISIAPILGLIYSQTRSSFSERTPAGVELKRIYEGQLVDWYVDTLSLVPSLEVQYKKILAEDWKVTLTSSYAWFTTRDVARSSIYQKISGHSSYWDNRADLDVRLPLKLFGFPLHTGSFVSAGIPGGDLREGLDSSAIYALNGRLVLGDLKGLGILDWVGLGVTYFQSNNFSGFSWGLDMSFAL